MIDKKEEKPSFGTYLNKKHFAEKKKNSSCDYIKENKSLETRKAYAVLKSFTCTDIEFLKLYWIN